MLNEVVAARTPSNKMVHILAVGAATDLAALKTITGDPNRVKTVSTFSEMEAGLTAVNKSAIADQHEFLNGLYAVYYASPKRSGSHTVKMAVKDNLCTTQYPYTPEGFDCTLSGTYSATGFVNTVSELIITGPESIESGSSGVWKAKTLYNNDPLIYQWSLLANPNGEFAITPDPIDNRLLRIKSNSIIEGALATIRLQTYVDLGGGVYLLIDQQDRNITTSDGISSTLDNCPGLPNADQLDSDADGQGNACDTDDDGDGVFDLNDLEPFNPSAGLDTDRDGVADTVDKDDDGDGIPDTSDTQPKSPNPKLLSIAANDGWLLESAALNNKGGTADSRSSILIVGDSLKNQAYRSILHFDTAKLPNNAVITKATLTLKKQSLKGVVKPLGNLLVDLKQKNFGSNASLATNDFEAKAGKTSVGTFKVSGNPYSAVLTATGKANISKTAATQFKIHFTKDDNNDKGDDYLKFYSGNASSSTKPSLVIEYYVP
jgi:hypothetical protein